MLVPRRNRSVLLCTLLSIAVLAQGSDIYISPGAVGGNGTFDYPYGTIMDALVGAQAGDALVLMPGTYTNVNNTMLSVRVSLTLRSYNNDPTSTRISWDSMGPTAPGFINTNITPVALRVEGLGFSGKVSIEDSVDDIYESIFDIRAGSSLVMNNCRFDNMWSDSPYAVLYVHAYNLSSVSISNCTFYKGSGVRGITVEGAQVNITNCNFVEHLGRYEYGTCIYVPSFRGTQPNVNIIGNTFVKSWSPVYVTLGKATLGGNSFYNCNHAVICGNLSSVVNLGNSFCGYSNTTCAAMLPDLNSFPKKPWDGCGVCNGDNSNKDCNGICFGGTPLANCTIKREIYVQPNGAGDGSSRQNPLGTIAAAIQLANDGEKVVLLAGTYSGPGNFNLSIGKAITITSENGNPDTDNVTIDCGGILAAAFHVYSGESYDTVVTGINIEHCGNAYGLGTVRVTNGSGITFRRVNFRHDGNLQTDGGGFRLIQGFLKLDDVIFENTTAYFGLIHLTSSSYVKVVNSKFLKCYANYNGGSFWSDSSTLEVLNNYFIDADSALLGAIFEGQYSNFTFIGNSFYNSGVTAEAYTGKSYRCANIYSSTVASNSYCGNPNTVSSFCPPFNGNALNAVADDCGVCGGNNSAKDCSQVCFGRDTSCL